MRRFAYPLFAFLGFGFPTAVADPLDDILGFGIPDPTPVSAILEQENAAVRRVTVAHGGEVIAEAEDGTTYRLVFPPNSVPEDMDVMLTPLSAVRFAEGEGEGVGFDLQPEGTVLIEPARVVISLRGAAAGLNPAKLRVFDLVGARGKEGGRIGIPLPEGLGIFVTHFSGGTVNVGGREVSKISLVDTDWKPHDSEQGGAASIEDRYRQAGERLRIDMESHRLEPRHIMDELEAWWKTAVDALTWHAGETEAEYDARLPKARFNAEVAQRLMSAFEDAIADRFAGVAEQLVETQRKLNEAAEGGEKEALRLAESGLADAGEELLKAFARVAAAERQCQILPNSGCEGKRPNLEALAKILETYAKHFKFDCARMPKMVQTLLTITRAAKLGGASEAATRFMSLFNNWERTCFQFEVLIDARLQGRYVDLADLVYDFGFDVQMRVVTRISPAEGKGAPVGVSLIIRRFDFSMRGHERCDFGIDEISASLIREPTLVLDKLDGKFQISLSPGKIDAFLHYFDKGCADPYDWNIDTLWDDAFKHAMEPHDLGSYLLFQIPFVDSEGAQPASKEFTGSAEWEADSVRNSASLITKIAVRRLK